MTGLAVLLILPLIVVPFFLAIGSAGSYWSRRREERGALFDTFLKRTALIQLKPFELVEFFYMGLSPLAGIALVYFFQEDIKPFGMSMMPTLILYVAVGWSSYWLSRYKKETLPDGVNVFLTYGMLAGAFLYLLLTLHYISPMTVLGVMIFPYLAFPLLAPFPALLYTLREIRQLQDYMNSKEEEKREIPGIHSEEKQLVDQIRWRGMVHSGLTFIGFLACLQLFLLVVFGLPLDSLFLLFAGGEDFLFSFPRSIFDF
jgi:hypothetical protein